MFLVILFDKRGRGCGVAAPTSRANSVSTRLGHGGGLPWDGARTVTAAPVDQDLTAPAVKPATIHRCAIRNMRIAGRMVSVMKASTNCHRVEYWP